MPTFKKDKQVRFAYNLHTFHSPGVPALKALAPSVPSSITPPSTTHPLPRSSSYSNPYFSPSLHPLLEATAVNWNLMEHLSTLTLNNHLFPSRAFYEQATTPPLPFLSITSLYLPWSIDVYASNGSFVTVGDVFSCIYRSLRTNITTMEFNSFPNQREQVRATRAYEQRYRRFRQTYGHDEEKRGGMKRIDFLMGHTRFHGISNSGHHPDQWQLNVLPLSTWFFTIPSSLTSMHVTSSFRLVAGSYTPSFPPKDVLSVSVFSMLWVILSPTLFRFSVLGSRRVYIPYSSEVATRIPQRYSKLQCNFYMQDDTCLQSLFMWTNSKWNDLFVQCILCTTSIIMTTMCYYVYIRLLISMYSFVYFKYERSNFMLFSTLHIWTERRCSWLLKSLGLKFLGIHDYSLMSYAVCPQLNENSLQWPYWPDVISGIFTSIGPHRTRTTTNMDNTYSIVTNWSM